MSDFQYYYLGREKMRDLTREAQNEREAQAAMRENRRNKGNWLRRLTGNDNGRAATGEKN